MWHKASEELPEVGQLVIVRRGGEHIVLEVYSKGDEIYFDRWIEFPINGWIEAKDFKDTIREFLVLASNVHGFIVNEDFFFSKCDATISCGFSLYTHYQYLPLID